MTQKNEIDAAAAHRQFSVQCFNEVWGLIEKKDRTPEEDRQMVLLNMASIWHWTQRDDCTNQNMSIGYWQASRVHAIIGDFDSARNFGKACLEYSRDEAPFYMGYAYEALARAEMVAGDKGKMSEYMIQAQQLLEKIEDPEEKKYLQDDLNTIK
jgi:hypothetical protein